VLKKICFFLVTPRSDYSGCAESKKLWEKSLKVKFLNFLKIFLNEEYDV